MKKIVYSFVFAVFVMMLSGCVHEAIIDDTPKELTDVDFIRIDKLASLHAQEQNSVMELSGADLAYAMKYFQHFSEVLALAQVNAVLIKVDNLEQLNIHSAENKNFIEFVNLLSYYKINVIYEFDLDKLLVDFKENMTKEEELEYSEYLKEELAEMLEFFNSFDDKSKIATLCFTMKLPTVQDLQIKSKKGGFLDRAGNNSYGFEKDNQQAFDKALIKLNFARKFFGLEQLIWKVDLTEITLGLADKLLNRKKLDFEILPIVDMMIFQIDFAEYKSRAPQISGVGKISKSVMIEVNLPEKIVWDNFINDAGSVINESLKNESFGGMIFNNYGIFYKIWRFDSANSAETGVAK